ncbi:MAG TPA: tRNA 2-thiouridine(34) synthase MnmA [bacterium]|nr:tRNA 2-thiouridine(34) synthase MnmA [bacterium]HPV65361.1 tRNA 2-thiouridine(34) synthase MnmA [bacterium]
MIKKNKTNNKTKDKIKEKVLVAISGGVDSAVAAKLLIDDGYDVSGIFLNFWKEPGEQNSENKCCSLEAQLDAKKVCLSLGIPFYTFNFSSKFKKEVVDNFLNEYQIGNTPNPCVVCNKKIKIGGLLEYAKSLGFNYLATGHYVKIKKCPDGFYLFKGVDKNKDQSYFLYTLEQKQLKNLLFPLGNLKKPKVRQIASKSGLPVASKNESQEICFISGKRHNDFLKKYLKLKPGKIILWPENKIIGEHQGLPLYTIGQRRGIDIGGTGPYYAASFDYQKKYLYVVKNFDDPILYGKEMLVKNFYWTNKKNLKFPLKTKVVIRYRHKAVSCVVEPLTKKKLLKVKFLRKQRAITFGQSAVFYNGSQVLGGGIIC